MREIKFRAWDVFYKKFIYSDEMGMVAFWKAVQGGIDAGREVPVMQFTGLLDKNGKEIYEGDVLGYGGAKAEVKYDPEVAVYYDIFGLGFASLANQSEVIGNIYEHPELLTK